MKKSELKLIIESILLEMYESDNIRIKIINAFLKKIKINTKYNTHPPEDESLIDDFDGYDDQIYIQNDIAHNKIIYYEGWVDACWEGAYAKSEYKDLSKEDIINDVIDNRFPHIASKCGLKILNSTFYLYDNEYIMKITLKQT